MTKEKPKKKLLYPVVFMVLISMGMSLVLATLNQVTFGIIKEQEANQERMSILFVLGVEHSSSEDITRIFAENIVEKKWNDKTFYIYKEGGQELAYVFPIIGNAVWGPVKAFGAIDIEKTTLLGIDFVRHSETPGLGGRIEDFWFREQFRGIDITGDPPFVTYRPAPNGNVDAISGATSTSNAVLNLINEKVDEFRTYMKGGGA